jgi:hypothetical protein
MTFALKENNSIDYLVGTRCFSSSSQFNTNWICAMAGSPDAVGPAATTATNRLPQGMTSKASATETLREYDRSIGSCTGFPIVTLTNHRELAWV